MGKSIDKNESINKIIEGAIIEFGEKNFAEASTNSICKISGVSKGLLFHYYKSKDQLFLECVSKCFNEITKYTTDNMTIESIDISKNLQKYFQVRLEFFKEYPHFEHIFISAMFNAPMNLTDDILRCKNILDITNKTILESMLKSLTLKENLNLDEIIDYILDFGNFLVLKYKKNNAYRYFGDEKVFENYNDEFVKFVKMLLYGILK